LPLFSFERQGMFTRTNTMRPRLTLLTVALSLIGVVSDLPAQSEHGRAMTDAQGRFKLDAPRPGTYRLQSAVIGIRSTITQPFTIEAGQEIKIDFLVQALFVTLPTVVIEDERTCEGPPDAGMAASVLWEEARKALQIVTWTEQQEMLLYEVVLYERELDPNTLEILTGRRRTYSEYQPRGFFSTQDSVSAVGYVQQGEDGGLVFSGPDAEVLLSEGFASQHCFGVKQGTGDRAGYVGLSFTPALDRRLPDIEGVLWLDRETAELRLLEYKYTNVPVALQSEQIGGRVEFEALPHGLWIVRRWWIRMPIFGTRQQGYSDFLRETYLKAVEEDGGWVTGVETLDGTAVIRSGVGTLTGEVVNLRAAQPLAGATIILVGTEYETRTDRNGQFRFDKIPEGTYRVSFGHEILFALGYVPPLTEVTLSLDHPGEITMVIPPLTRLWPDICPGGNPQRGGIVAGFVRDSVSLQPVPGTQVLVYREGDTRERAETMSDWAGHFAVCDLPPDVRWVIEVRRAGPSGVVVRKAAVIFDAGDIVRADFAIPERG
jgi:hypothetical protein